MGHMRMSPEVVIGTREGCVKAWTIRRRPEEERWDMTEINQMKGTPEEPIPGEGRKKVPTKIDLGGTVDEGVGLEFAEEPKPEPPKRAYIRKRWFEEYGWDEQCEGCRHARAGLPTRNHREECRRRMEEHMAKSATGKKLLEEAKRRGSEYCAERVERDEKRRKSQEDEKAQEET